MTKKRNKAHATNPFLTIKTFGKKNISSKLKTIKKRILKEELKKVSNEDSYSLSLIMEKQNKVPSVSIDSNIENQKLIQINEEKTLSPSSIISSIDEDEVFGALEDFVNAAN